VESRDSFQLPGSGIGLLGRNFRVSNHIIWKIVKNRSLAIFVSNMLTK
jgi:hypothetical protein